MTPTIPAPASSGAPNAALPVVSILIPCNARPSITATIDSILASRLPPPYEILVIGTLPPGLRPPPSVRLIPCDPRRTGPMRNLGASKATGEILLFTDSDCVVDPDWLAGAAAACTHAHPVVAGGIRFSEQNPCDYGDNLAIFHSVHVSCPPGPARGNIGTNNLAMRRDLFRELGGFDERLSIGDDYELLLRASQAGHPAEFDPAFAVLHQSDRNTPAQIRAHACWYAEGTAHLLRENLQPASRLRMDTLLARLPLAPALWSAFKATLALLAILFRHPRHLRFLRALPYAWLFLYTRRRQLITLLATAPSATVP